MNTPIVRSVEHMVVGFTVAAVFLVSATASGQLIGLSPDSTTIPAGDSVTLDVYFETPAAFSAVGATIAPTGLSGGDSGSLIVVDVTVNEAAGFVATAQTDPPSWSWTALHPAATLPGVYYLGSLELSASDDAGGTFVLEFDQGQSWILDLFADPMRPLTLDGAQIIVEPKAPCCVPERICVLLTEAACTDAGGSPVEECLGDANVNGFDDACEDCDGDGIPDMYETDPLEQDCDFDGICNGVEIAECAGDPACGDCNSNGVPDGCDIADGVSSDVNGNGIPDECEPDCNGNSIPDDWDIATCADDPACDDCNDNGVPDECDIADGTSRDRFGVFPLIWIPDGIPDECQMSVPRPPRGELPTDKRISSDRPSSCVE